MDKVNKDLLTSLKEMVEAYWGHGKNAGDGIDPPPGCIQRALIAIGEAEKHDQ